MSHVCDCGIRYSNLDALMACQNSNHGFPGFGEKAIRNAAIEECALAAHEAAMDFPNAERVAAAIRKLKTT